MSLTDTFKVSWKKGANGGSPIQDYIVQYSANAGASWNDYVDGPSLAKTTVLSGLASGSSYLFRVVAVNALGQSPGSVPAFAVKAPQNNFSAPGALTANFTAVVGFTPTTGSVAYQWQVQTSNGWVNLAGQTAATLQMTPAIYVAAGGNGYETSARVRCGVGAENCATVVSSAARWLDLSQRQFSLSVYVPATGDYPQGQITENGVVYETLSTAPDATVQIDLSDYSYGADDVSWFTGNNWTLQLQTSADGITWTDNYSVGQRTANPYASRQITAPSGVSYWRWRAIYNWPLTTNDGTLSADRQAYAFPPYSVKITT